MKRRDRRSALIETLEPRWLLTYFGDFGNAKTPSNITIANGAVLYLNDDGTHGTEIWRSDGTPAGTALVKDIRPGPEPIRGADVDYVYRSFPPKQPLYTWNGSTYFAADDGVHGSELWKTDGTAAGTVLVSDISPGEAPSAPGTMVAFNGALYFDTRYRRRRGAMANRWHRRGDNAHRPRLQRTDHPAGRDRQHALFPHPTVIRLRQPSLADRRHHPRYVARSGDLADQPVPGRHQAPRRRWAASHSYDSV
jgi:ELWxxDGT repeat protein